MQVIISQFYLFGQSADIFLGSRVQPVIFPYGGQRPAGDIRHSNKPATAYAANRVPFNVCATSLGFVSLLPLCKCNFALTQVRVVSTRAI